MLSWRQNNHSVESEPQGWALVKALQGWYSTQTKNDESRQQSSAPFRISFENSDRLFPRSSDALTRDTKLSQWTESIPPMGSIYSQIKATSEASKPAQEIKTERPTDDIQGKEDVVRIKSTTESCNTDKKSLKSFPVGDLNNVGVGNNETASVVSNFGESSVLTWTIGAPVDATVASSSEVYLDWLSETSLHEDSSVATVKESLFSTCSAMESSFQSCEIEEDSEAGQKDDVQFQAVCNPNRRDPISRYTRFQAQLDEILRHLVVNWRWTSSCVVWTLLVLSIVVVLSLGTHDKIKGTSFILPEKQTATPTDVALEGASSAVSPEGTESNASQDVLRRQQQTTTKTNSTVVVYRSTSSKQQVQESEDVVNPSKSPLTPKGNKADDGKAKPTKKSMIPDQTVGVDYHPSPAHGSNVVQTAGTTLSHNPDENSYPHADESVGSLLVQDSQQPEVFTPQDLKLEDAESIPPLSEMMEVPYNDFVESPSLMNSPVDLLNYYDRLDALLEEPFSDTPPSTVATVITSETPESPMKQQDLDEYTDEAPSQSTQPFEPLLYPTTIEDIVTEELYNEWPDDYNHDVDQQTMNINPEAPYKDLDITISILVPAIMEDSYRIPTTPPEIPFIQEDVDDGTSSSLIPSEHTHDQFQSIAQPSTSEDSIEALSPLTAEPIFHGPNENVTHFSDVSDKASIFNTTTNTTNATQSTPNVALFSDENHAEDATASTSERQSKDRGVWNSYWWPIACAVLSVMLLVSIGYIYKRRRRSRSNIIPEIMIESGGSSSGEDASSLLPELDVVTGRTNADQIPDEELDRQQRDAEARRDLDSAAGRKTPSQKRSCFNGVYFPFKSVQFSMIDFAIQKQRSKNKVTPS